MYLLTKGVQVKDGWYSSTLKEVDSIKLMVVYAMRLVRGPYPRTVYDFRMEKGRGPHPIATKYVLYVSP